MSKQDGVPATAVTMRDYFAAAALQGMYPLEPAQNITREEYASEAYRMADAMLEAREVV